MMVDVKVLAVDSSGASTPFVVTIPTDGGNLPTDITFDPTTIEQHGPDSDQWPSTWADDGELYAAWGDGFGLNDLSPKRTLGISTLSTPPGVTGVDVYGLVNPNRKPLGIVADTPNTINLFYTTADDNWDGSFEAVSNNNGAAWTYQSTPIFSRATDGVWVVGIAQFGPGYTGVPAAADGFYYVYLSDRNEHVYLGRVSKSSLFDRSTYQFYSGVTVWDANWANRVPVYSDPAGIGGDWFHVGITWNPNISMYIMVKGHNFSDLGVFMGPNPWGPWTTLYYGPFQDGFRKFTFQTPQKWMVGTDLWLTWSGHPEYDNVNFIKAVLA